MKGSESKVAFAKKYFSMDSGIELYVLQRCMVSFSFVLSVSPIICRLKVEFWLLIPSSSYFSYLSTFCIYM